MKSLQALLHVVAVVSVAACASGGPSAGNNSTVAPSPDPRVGLKPGRYDAGQAQWNMRLVSTTKPPAGAAAPPLAGSLAGADPAAAALSL